MQITVFGASGKIGRLVVAELLSKDYDVVAFVHSNPNFAQSDKLKIIKGDIHNATDIKSAIEGSEIIISTLGSWHTKSKDILSSAVRNFIPAMHEQGISRIITLTGSDARAKSDNPNLLAKLMRPVLKIMSGKILLDGEEHIRILEDSDLNYTVVRSPVMRSIGSKRASLNLIAPNIWETVHRHDVASAICSEVEYPRFSRQSPFIH